MLANTETVLEQDYTGALTLLLRYPSPQAPFGPSSFVTDALYLRDNLLLDGGDHIISKYSNKSPETTVSRKLPKKVKRARTAEQDAAQHASELPVSPRESSEHGGIESIIQEAARGLYNTGERWGVAKALRGAVQGLQANVVSPSVTSRQSLDSQMLHKRIQSFEERNAKLSKMLASAMDELWVEQDEIRPADVEERNSDALSLAIAKVQFVQVYLENSTMQLPTELNDTSKDEREETHRKTQTQTQPVESTLAAPAVGDGHVDERKLAVKTKPKASRPSTQAVDQPSSQPQPPRTPPNAAQKHRPPLSESPYSWMLGDEPPKSEFVPSSTSPGGAINDRSKKRDLFGVSAGAGTERNRNDDMTRRRR